MIAASSARRPLSDAMLLRIKPSGAPEFEVDVEDGATLQDVKVAATAGCDIDPELMKIIYKGRAVRVRV